MAPQTTAPEPLELFYSYSHKDEGLRNELETHLAMLKNEGVIRGWHDRQITAGQEWDGQIDEHLNSADIILLLASPDFLASKYCYDIEVARAMERHEAGEARVVPVILRPCEWQRAPFSKLQALPTGTVPITRWPDRDDAFLNVTEGLRRAVEELLSAREETDENDEPLGRTSPTPLIPRPPIIGFVSRRDAEGRDIVERLKEELAPGHHQMVTLSGPGGIGKTTLAAEAARKLQAAYEGRVVWSSAEGRANFTFLSLLDDIATQLGHPELRMLAPAEKEEQVHAVTSGALVVLDNYETVAGAEQKTIEAWLKRTQCAALFTSRLRVPETLFVTVSAMSREEGAEFLGRLAEQTQDPHIFTAKVRERVYETAEANPFVMQWVAGQIDLAQEPGTVLEELSHGEGDAALRIFDRSFNLPQLGDEGRTILFALSLFKPSASRSALSAITGFHNDEARFNEAIEQLILLGLAVPIAGGRRISIGRFTRELVGRNLLKVPGFEEVRQRFVEYFLHYTDVHASVAVEDNDNLEVEKYNVFSAVAMHRRQLNEADKDILLDTDQATLTPCQQTNTDVFISYSHNDTRWLEKIQKMLKPYVRKVSITIWDDSNINAGALWREEIRKAIDSAKVAILLVSPDFIASDFIAENELPPLLKAAKEKGLTILWIAVSASWYEETEIANYEAANDPSRPLDSLKSSQVNKELVNICKQIKGALNSEQNS